MGSRVGLGKARHVAVRYLWLQQLVADKTIKLVKVKGTQHPPDVGTEYLIEQAGYVARQEHVRFDGAGVTSAISVQGRELDRSTR
eukprot:5084484-Amphidinium_carterae.2